MYANLRVRYRAPKHRRKTATEKVVFACLIQSDADWLIIGLDANDGHGNYAIPNGELRIPCADLIDIEADY
jgi:hypothetical protein